MSLSWYNEEKFEQSAVRKSPPDPFTHKTSTVSPFNGSISIILADVLPPPVLVIRWSLPKILDL